MVTIYCKNNDTYRDYPLGTSLLDIYNDLGLKLKYPVVAARVNYKVEPLSFQVYRPKSVEFIDLSKSSGHRVYVRTICMVLAKAVSDLMPNTTLRVEHPISHGYYCSISDKKEEVELELILAIKKRMLGIIEENLPIHSIEQQTHSVIDQFSNRGQNDNVALLETLGVPYARYFKIGDFIDYYSGILLPSTGCINNFDIVKYKNGFLLQVPDKVNPDVLARFEDQPKIFDIFNEFVNWNRLMGISNVGDFNLKCQGTNLQKAIKVSEALHEKKIAQIADMIHSKRKEKRFVMISGPSSSGKTTFSKRLSVQLMVVGIRPIVLSLDNYFVDRESTPLDENGEWDFENIHSIDLPLINDHLSRLMNGERVEIPVFNFEDGKRYWNGDSIQLDENTMLIMEGIHALNPELTNEVPESVKFKIYVSALTTISLDNHNWISTTDTRLLRRIVRDCKFRNYSAKETIARWPSVVRGEEKWIFPFQENADVMFNSALLFEFAVLRRPAEPILAEVSQNCDEYTEAHRMLKFLRYFKSIPENDIPATSLLREFLGGSSFQD